MVKSNYNNFPTHGLFDHYSTADIIKHGLAKWHQSSSKGKYIAYLGIMTSTKLPFLRRAQDKPAT
jgi:hypothetical protein